MIWGLKCRIGTFWGERVKPCQMAYLPHSLRHRNTHLRILLQLKQPQPAKQLARGTGIRPYNDALPRTG